MSKIIKQLRSLALISSVEPVLPDETVLGTLQEVQRKRLSEILKITSVFRIAYRSGRLNIVGYLALPKKIDGDRLPCIIYNRGGSFDFGKITPTFALLRLAAYASWGYVVIASQYRGNDGSDGREEWGGEDVDDVLRLRHVLKSMPWADASRIGMIGHSRGGMMTYRALAKVKWIKAAVCGAALANFVRNTKVRPDMRRVAKKIFGTSLAELKQRSAVYWVQKFSKKTPILLMHGNADWRVLPQDSLDMAALLGKSKIPHKLVLFEGDDHGMTEHRKQMMQETRDWMDRFVKNGEALPNMKPHGS